jgi:2-C-methyl-D-erythritol 4-phosphate cytidylyltransferase/2-C-methyl-D-erythritol 2,4-cyclodiphosphate synthase
VTTAALIVAAGRGSRLGGPRPKQYLPLGGEPILARTLRVFLTHPDVDQVLAVISPADVTLYDDLGVTSAKLLPPVHGGTTRQASVRHGLQALAALGATKVLIHDGARPFVAERLVSDCLRALQDGAGAIAAIPVTDTLKVADASGRVARTLDRTGLWRAQTPQAFRLPDIAAAHEKAAAGGISDLTDDAAVAEWAGIPVALVPGDPANVKITTAEDLRMAQVALTGAAGPDIRVGQGYDIHQLVPGDHVWLCGVKIPHDHKLDGHSDADVGLHALTDALLGTIADADIGTHFKNTDPRWRGAASHLFLEDAARRVREASGRILNVDITLLCEAPKISPHRDAMRARIAEVLKLDIGRVSIKATTMETLGAIGRREGIAALATATVIIG